MAKKSEQLKRLEIPFFDGVNSLVASHIAKKQELEHAENARSVTIGSIEKRQGTRRLGDIMTATANSDIFYFDNDTATNTGFYRISTISAVTSIYYLNSSGTWTVLTGNGASLTAAQFSHTIAEGCLFLVNNKDANRYIDSDGDFVYTGANIGSSTTQIDITNPSGSTFRYTYDGTGTAPLFSTHMQVGDVVHITASDFSAGNKGAFSVTAVAATYFEVTNGSGVVESNKTIGTGVIRVNNHLIDAPVANKINFYKDRLYVGDYTDTTRYKTGIMMSSTPLGITALVDDDHTAPITSLKVTDTKYIKEDDVLDIYRGGTKIGTIIVTAKNTDTSTLTIDSFATDLKSSDEVWIGGTYTGKRVFRWADNPQSGENVKRYDTFKLTGGQNDRITMMENIGDFMIISNKFNLAAWNGYNLQSSDLDIGCVSDNGYVKVLGTLWFVGYEGLYSLAGGTLIPKLMSAKVDRYIDGTTKAGLEASAVGKKGLSVFFAIGDVSLYNPDGSAYKTLSDMCLEYNIRQEGWFPHTNIKATQFATYVSSTDAKRLEYTSTESKYEVMEMLYNELDDSSNSASEIQFRIDTSNITLSKEFEKIAYLHSIVIEAERGSGIQCFVSLDNGAFYEIEGQAAKGCTILKVTNKNENVDKPPRCRNVKISIRDNTRKLCKISRIAIVYSDTQEEENEKLEPYNV